MAKKRARERRDINVRLVEIFEDLASENEKVRLEAARLLLARENLSHEDVRSTFRRLVRGLCSGRKAARLGFSVALTEFLVHYSFVQSSGHDDLLLSNEEVLKLIREQTHLNGDSTGQEGRDHYLGRLFAAEATIKSKVIFKHKDTNAWSQVLELIFETARKKSWLREHCGWVLLQALRIVQKLPGGDVYAQSLVDKLNSNEYWRSLEGVALWIATQELIPSITLPKDVFRNNDPLSRSERSMLTKVLKQTESRGKTDQGQGKDAQPGIWTSKLHFAWEIIFSSCMGEASGRVSFSDLWIEIVDDGMFANSSSEERKHRGFLLVQRHIANVPSDKIPIVLGKNFVRCLVNQYAQSQRYLHNIAERTAKVIFNRAGSDGLAASIILKTILGSRGYVNFDSLTKSKSIEKVLRDLPLEYAKSVIARFGDILVQPGVEQAKLASSKRQIVTDYLLTLTRSLAVPATHDALILYQVTVESLLVSLVQAAYLEQPPTPENIQPRPRFTAEERQIFRSRIHSCLTHLIAIYPEPAYFPYKIADMLLSSIDTGANFALKADEGVVQTIQRAGKALSKIHAKAVFKDHEKAASYSAFELLFSMAIIQACSGEADAANILEELLQCYKPLLKANSHGKPSSESGMLVEIILSLVSKPSLLFRRLAQQVFSSFTSSVGEEGLESMIQILETKESVAGQSELFDQEDVEMDDAKASDDEDVDSTDSSIESASERSDSNDSGADAVDEDDDELIDLDKKLSDALGTRRADADAAIEGSESSEESMDDEQMASLDPVMTSIFRERTKQPDRKKEQKDAKENIVQFKCRVLELIRTYLKQQFPNPTSLILVHPLLSLIGTTSSKQVSQKACEIIREFLKLYKLNANGSQNTVALKQARGVLPIVHSFAVSSESNALLNACSQASLLLTKVIVSNGGTLHEAWEVYAKTGQKMAVDPQCKISSSLFQDWFNWLTSAKVALEKARP